MKRILFVFFIVIAGKLFAQKITYHQLNQKFERLYLEHNQDSAILVAKEMNKWALSNQSDTSILYAESFRLIANSFYYNQQLDSALNYYNQSVVYLSKQNRLHHLSYASTANNLGNLHRTLGNYNVAEKLYLEALQIRKSILGDLSIDYSKTINNLGILYKLIGDYKLAESLYKHSLEIKKETLGIENPAYAESLNNLAILYKEMGNYKLAESTYKESLEIKTKILGEYNLENAKVFNNLGILYKEVGDFNLAESLLIKSLDIKKKAFGVNHINCAESLINLANLYTSIGNYKSAELFYIQSLEIIKQFLGENHTFFISSNNQYAKFLTKTDRQFDAFTIFKINFQKKSDQIKTNFEWLNDYQKEVYWKKENYFYDNLSWFANQSYFKVPEATGLNYNSVLLSKSKMLETKISSENYYREIDELREKLTYKRKLIAKIESEESSEKGKLDKLSSEVDSLDKRLTMSWPEYAQQKKNLSITWEQVQQNLEKGEAAIEFVRFKNEDDSLYYYNALIIRKEDKYPQLVKLCKEKDLEKIQPKLGFSPYYSLVWQPMEIVLKEVKTIYYAPIGLLNNVPFNAMYSNNNPSDEIVLTNESSRGSKTNKGQVKTPKNMVYLMDKYALHQLTSTRYLAMGLKQKEKERFNTAMAMVGGVNYDFLPGSSNTIKKSKRNKDQSRSSSSAQQKLIYLEGTKFEIEQIDKKVTTSGWISTVLESNQATEENIIKLEGKEAKGILHIATHGYAFPEYDFNDTLINKNSLQYSYRYSTNPMVRSGLILAGGNWAWTGSDTLSKLGAEQNGILTALEVSQLNLKKTKLVVLSACETGLGKIEGSEGTFGLKRGFKLAGVEQIIVSLWSVPDKETMELMTLFYSDLAKTLNPVISFEKAQKEMRINYPTEPEKWAGFVLVR